MAVIHFAPALQRHCAAPSLPLALGSVREMLVEAFQHYPKMQSYVLDDQGMVRKHVVIFLDGMAIEDRQFQSDLVSPQSEIYVMQALSGG
jgi:molybdopterin synthase sulfur carrier subunit